MKRVALGLIAVMGVAAGTTIGGRLQEDPQSAMKRQIVAMSRGAVEGHKALGLLVGKFDEVTTIHAGPADVVSKSTCEAKWVMGGRYVRLESASVEGEELKGERMIVYGYDPTAKRYTQYSIDTMGVTGTTATGTFDEVTKTFTFAGVREMPGSGGAGLPYQQTIAVDEAGTVTQVISVGVPGGAGGGEPMREMVKTVRTKGK